MQRLLTLIHALGMMLVMFSITYILPIFTSYIYHDGTLIDFALAMVMTLAVGSLMWLLTRHNKGELSIRHGYFLVVMMWTAMPAFATMPLLLLINGLSFTDAYFETMSGMTTTGATVLTGLDALPPAINLWRHELSWLGGMGIIVLVVAILPLLGVGGRQLYKAEMPGPMKDTTLAPRIAETARNLWLVYLCITVVCIISLHLAGMSWLDAICHAFTTVGLGGFSTHDASVGYFNSSTIELVMTIFMLLAAMNFATHFRVWRKKNLKLYLLDTESLGTAIILVVSCFAIGTFLWWQNVYPSFWAALRYASFNLVSIAANCGFSSTDFSLWPIFAPLWMLFLSCIAASSGSTGSGIKMIRTLILIKQAGREFLKLLHPAAINPLKIGGRVVADNIVFSVLGFIFLYFMSVVVLTFALVISGLDFLSAFSGIVACINNVGPALGILGPASNYGVLSDFQTWVCTVAMLIGRLEIITVLIIFTPHFWRR
ncbi:Trk system potassium uptake protein TrkH [Candidatus Nitrotoga sp. BS]|uniref:TrkH family potassium uptake protein n=1 Tax=Candidatus Nitrotoga sp. BS TaxID=2890408 RepID=UPI001EF311B7|nr:potassium transporter TrkG [Candidatus Nitrotoga sp. BS]CAH1198309.1 Trk system potassium uptake protein TrkH [Candidatus Nitrotoga sp. BS]